MLSRKIFIPVLAVIALVAAILPALAEPLACKGQGSLADARLTVFGVLLLLAANASI